MFFSYFCNVNLKDQGTLIKKMTYYYFLTDRKTAMPDA